MVLLPATANGSLKINRWTAFTPNDTKPQVEAPEGRVPTGKITPACSSSRWPFQIRARDATASAKAGDRPLASNQPSGFATKRALDADPNHANNLGNYARLLFILGDDSKAERLSAQAIARASEVEDPLRAECNSYLFTHVPSSRPASGVALKELLARGVFTGSWDFSQNLSRCAAANDPRLPLLEAVAKALAAGDPSDLQGYPEWEGIGKVFGGRDPVHE